MRLTEGNLVIDAVVPCKLFDGLVFFFRIVVLKLQTGGFDPTQNPNKKRSKRLQLYGMF